MIVLLIWQPIEIERATIYPLLFIWYAKVLADIISVMRRSPSYLHHMPNDGRTCAMSRSFGRTCERSGMIYHPNNSEIMRSDEVIPQNAGPNIEGDKPLSCMWSRTMDVMLC